MSTQPLRHISPEGPHLGQTWGPQKGPSFSDAATTTTKPFAKGFKYIWSFDKLLARPLQGNREDRSEQESKDPFVPYKHQTQSPNLSCLNSFPSQTHPGPCKTKRVIRPRAPPQGSLLLICNLLVFISEEKAVACLEEPLSKSIPTALFAYPHAVCLLKS